MGRVAATSVFVATAACGIDAVGAARIEGEPPADGRLVASLSDASAPSVTKEENTSVASSSYAVRYTIDFLAATPGAPLDLRWTLVTGSGTLRLAVATLRRRDRRAAM